jgi:hypothetical protein
MAYSSTGLNAAGGQSKAGNAPQIWTYTSADAIATVNTSGYFNDASSLVKVGDIIYVYDSATPTMSITFVVSNASGVVDITDGLTVTATDTD